MKYLLLVYGNPENWEHPLFLRDPRFLALPGEERDAPAAQAEELLAEISASGELVEGTAPDAPASGANGAGARRRPGGDRRPLRGGQGAAGGAGLSTVEIARAFLLREPTMAQRIARTRRRIREDGARFAMPPLRLRPAGGGSAAAGRCDGAGCPVWVRCSRIGCGCGTASAISRAWCSTATTSSTTTWR